jgi:glucose/arabinose dehydrogenase
MILRSLIFSALFGFLAFARAASPGIEPQVVASGLENPWAVAFIGNGDMLVTERPGRLRLVNAKGQVSEPISGLPAIQAGRQGGLLDLITDSDFKSNRTLYFCYTAPDLDSPSSGANTTALASAKLSTDGKRLTDVRELFRQTPSFVGGLHFGCRIAESPDGKLFLGLGDRFSLMQQAQNLANHIGKIVRINKDGTVPKDNPFVGRAGVAPEIWSYGHRNIQGATFDSKGQLWMHEHGPQGGDELNVIRPGLNYGWPTITYGENYGGGKIGEGLTKAPGMEQPVVQWTPSIAPAGLAQITSDRYGESWRNSFVLGSLKFRYPVRLSMDGNTVKSQEIFLKDLGQRVRDVRQGPDGLIYLLTDRTDGQLIRLVPKP